MFDRMKRGMEAKATALAAVFILVGGSVALALPDEAIEGQATAAANYAAAQEKAAAAQENATNGEEFTPLSQETGVPEEVAVFLEGLHEWVSCIQDGARAHGEQQSDSETRVEDAEYDDEAKLALCGEKPENPNDEGEEFEGEGRPDDAGPPEHAGRPEHAGPPAHAGGGHDD